MQDSELNSDILKIQALEKEYNAVLNVTVMQSWASQKL